MSQSTVASLAEKARSVATEAVWVQWSGLGSMVVQDGKHRPRSVIDPEALVLASAALWEHERRLFDVAAWWAATGASLLSAHRVRALTKQFPDAAGRGFGEFAHLAAETGDRRWKGYSRIPPEVEPRPGKGPKQLRLSGECTLLLRLRAGMGPGARSDTFAFVLSEQSGGVGVKEIHQATGFSMPNVRAAARELALGGFLEEMSGYPTAYGTRPGFAEQFVGLLFGRSASTNGETGVPVWAYWSQIYSFLLTVATWDEPSSPKANRYVASSAARKLFGEYRWVFRANRIDVPDPIQYPGEAYLDAFEETVDTLGAWIREVV